MAIFLRDAAGDFRDIFPCAAIVGGNPLIQAVLGYVRQNAAASMAARDHSAGFEILVDRR
jgi:hypothetical protein